MAFDELDEVDQVLDKVVAHLLPPAPNHTLPQQGLTGDPLPHLVYNSESELESDSELDPDLPWREVQDIPSFQLREVIRNPQPTEKDSFPFQNDTSPPDITDNNDRDGLQGDWVNCISPYGLDTR